MWICVGLMGAGVCVSVIGIVKAFRSRFYDMDAPLLCISGACICSMGTIILLIL